MILPFIEAFQYSLATPATDAVHPAGLVEDYLTSVSLWDGAGQATSVM